jgi:hypothetical protein
MVKQVLQLLVVLIVLSFAILAAGWTWDGSATTDNTVATSTSS